MKNRWTQLLIGAAMLSTVGLLATGQVDAATVLTPAQMKAQLTEQDIQEATPNKAETEKNTATNDDIGMPIESGVGTQSVTPKASYPNVNNYILQKNYQHPNVTKELHQFEMFGYRTNDGLPSGVAVHYTANPYNYSARSEANYEINGGWQSAFVHTFIDAGTILNIHDTNYGAWGSGPVGNKYFTQFEMVTARNFEDFAKTTSYSAWYTAYLLHQYNLTPSLAQAHNGVGTVWSHSNITHYLGGTDHTDPDAYFAKYGYSMSQFFAMVQHYYGQMNETVTQRQNVNLAGHVNGGQPMYWLENSGMVKSSNMTNQLVNKKVTITQWIKTSLNKEYYLASVDGKVVAWIPKGSFKENELIVNQKDVNLDGTVVNGQQAYWATNLGIVSANQTTNIANKQVKVTKIATTSLGKKYYLVTVGGKQIFWIPISAFKQNELIVSRKSISLEGSVSNGYSEYWLTNTGIVSAGQMTNNLINKSVKITQLITTTSGKKYYLATVKGKQVAWIPVGAFQEQRKIIKINYVPGYGIALWNNYTNNRKLYSNRKLVHGSTWKYFKTAKGANGQTWYCLGGNQWVDGKYAKVN